MNIEVVRSVFGAVVPTAAPVTERKISIVPVLVIIALAGVTFIAYTDYTKQTKHV